MNQHEDDQQDTRETILALESAALERWSKGDPHGFSENAADHITYFDHLTQTRRDGIAAVKEHLARFEGNVDVPKSRMVNPGVRVYGDLAVLTFNWETYSNDGDLTSRWNATEVFRRTEGQWKYIHMHWATVQAA